MNLLFSRATRKHSSSKSSSSSSSIYGLDHAILNIPVPPPSMWMNLGYWKNETDFPSACTALLNEVLITASILDENGNPTSLQVHRRLHLLDVGIGCGDQSIHLLNLTRTHDESGSQVPLFDSYVGLTVVPTQAAFAARRVEHASSGPTSPSTTNRARIFCADAADPSSWTEEIKSALCSTHHETEAQPEPGTKGENEVENEGEEEKEEKWLLALDTLYHFHPSRKPLLHHTFSVLNASFMAFDLLLADSISPWEKLFLRLVCWVSGTPWANFLSRDEYEALLVAAGYDLDGITVRDISADVFAGMAGFLRAREKEVSVFGLSIGKFRAARVVFDWWARRRVVRGVIVVARR